MAGQLDVIVGGQFGSEAKGHVAAQLAMKRKNEGRSVHAVRVAGPNAGHTAVGVLDGIGYALRQVPVMAVADPDCRLYIAAGSEVDEEVLKSEVDLLDLAGYNVSDRLYVDGEATILTENHKMEEAGMRERVGSTGKGIGAARADRLMRNAPLYWHGTGEHSYNTANMLRRALSRGENVIIEGTQGYGLGLHAGFYPFCTSSDCRAIDFLAMAGLSPWMDGVDLDVFVVARTYPIRVAGNSGPLLRELTWEDLYERSNGYIKPEKTTVTQLIRRVGEWDDPLVRAALRANGAPSDNTHLVLSFLDYIDPGVHGAVRKEQLSTRAVDWIIDNCPQEPIAVTTGPDSIIWRY